MPDTKPSDAAMRAARGISVEVFDTDLSGECEEQLAAIIDRAALAPLQAKLDVALEALDYYAHGGRCGAARAIVKIKGMP